MSARRFFKTVATHALNMFSSPKVGLFFFKPGVPSERAFLDWLVLTSIAIQQGGHGGGK
jgi:hypothetical protein